MKRLLAILLTGALTLSFGAAVSAEEEALSGKIVVGTNRTDLVDSNLREMADEFEALHPGVEIELEAYQDPEQVIATRLAAQELPDIGPMISTVLNQDLPNYYLALDDVGITEDNYMFYDLKMADDGKIYGVASSANYYGMIYNKAVLAEAGVESVPTTMEEFYDACEKILAAGYLPVATNYKEGWPLRAYAGIMSVGVSENEQFINELVNADKLLGDTETGLLYGLDILNTLVEKGYAEPELMGSNWDGFKRDFGANKVGFFFLMESMISQIVDAGGNIDDMGFAPVPDTKGVVAQADWAFGISANTENPELAKAFFKYCFLDGEYCLATNVSTCSLEAEDPDPFVQEFKENGTPVLEIASYSNDFNACIKASEIDIEFTTLAQEYVMAEDKQTVIDDYNEKWDNARAEVLE